ncbi:MAG: glycosyltransferase family 4 protein, partial [Bacteroidetes bacterium]|nr:glycosyltransferase family 4 protein [Bacteroidota bacterium]
LEAFSKCLKKESNLNLSIIGDGVEKERLANLSKELGIENRINFIGALSPKKLREEIHKYGIFISSSLYETFGVALVEALGAGMPAVATKCGGPEDIITSKNGRLAETANAESLSNEILYVYRNYKGFDRKSIRQDAIDRFGKETCIQKMKQIIDGLN